MSLIFRKARPEDIDAVIDIRVDGWFNTYVVNPNWSGPAPAMSIDPRSDTTRNWLTAAAVGSDHEQLFVAEKAGEVIGLVDVESHPDEDHMHSFYVRNDQRGDGIGSQLLMVALEWLVAQGSGKPLTIHISEYNTRPIAYYQRLGFAIVDERVGNWWGRNDQGEQIIYDTKLVSPGAQLTLTRLQEWLLG